MDHAQLGALARSSAIAPPLRRFTGVIVADLTGVPTSRRPDAAAGCAKVGNTCDRDKDSSAGAKYGRGARYARGESLASFRCDIAPLSAA